MTDKVREALVACVMQLQNALANGKQILSVKLAASAIEKAQTALAAQQRAETPPEPLTIGQIDEIASATIGDDDLRRARMFARIVEAVAKGADMEDAIKAEYATPTERAETPPEPLRAAVIDYFDAVRFDPEARSIQEQEHAEKAEKRLRALAAQQRAETQPEPDEPEPRVVIATFNRGRKCRVTFFKDKVTRVETAIYGPQSKYCQAWRRIFPNGQKPMSITAACAVRAALAQEAK